jgi:hypothetical protein
MDNKKKEHTIHAVCPGSETCSTSRLIASLELATFMVYYIKIQSQERRRIKYKQIKRKVKLNSK